jgi:uncharacterized protein YjbI with pentapeptide repeats
MIADRYVIEPGADLTCAVLRGANLAGADFTGADLTCADLRKANLAGADFTRANLHNADLRGADLSCADLCGTNLRGADLRGTDLTGADLTRAYWVFDARFTSEQLTWLSLTGQLNSEQIASCVIQEVG